MIRILRPYLLLLFVCSLLVVFSGCAVGPRQKEIFPTYTLHNVIYYPLVSLCERSHVDWQYDTYTQKVTLTRDNHHLVIRVGDGLVLADSRVSIMKNPVDIHDGTVMVPVQFKEEIFDLVFKGSTPVFTQVCPLPRFNKIVIDPGHGGKDPGATGRTGLREKDVNLDIAHRLCTLLTSRGIKAIMTRTSDRFIELPDRPEIANREGADLFVSIHANSSRTRNLNGFEVYYVSPDVSDSQRALDSARNGRLNIEQTCFANDSLSLRAILWDMLYASNRVESAQLSRSVCLVAENSLGVNNLGFKPARFQVLKGARMPAILVEVGFLSNLNEERKLRNGYYRQKVAEAISEGILGYAQRFAGAGEHK